MKRIASISSLLLLTLLFGACATSNNVVNNKLISKRKYTKGYHINKQDRRNDGGDIANGENKANSNPTNNEDILRSSEEFFNSPANDFNKQDERSNYPNDVASVNENNIESTRSNTSGVNKLLEKNNLELKESVKRVDSVKNNVKKAKSANASLTNADLVKIILIVLLIIAAIALFSILDGLLGGLLSLILLILVILLLLSYFGVI